MKITEKEFLEFIDDFKNSLEFSRYKTLLVNPEFYFDDKMRETLGVIKYVYDLELGKDILFVNTDYLNKHSTLKNLLCEIRVIEQGRNKEIDCRSFKSFYGYKSNIKWGCDNGLILKNVTLKINHNSQLINLNLLGGNLVFDLNGGFCHYFMINNLFYDYHFCSMDTTYHMNEFIFLMDGWEVISDFENFQSMISSKSYMIKKPLILLELDLYSIRNMIDSGEIWKFLDTISRLNLNNLRIVGINYNENYNKKFLDELKIRNIRIPLYIYDIDDIFLYTDLSFDTFFDDLKSENLK